MIERIINSFGNIVIPSEIRKELEIQGNCSLWVGVRVNSKGEKEIVIKKSNDLREFYDKYKKWSEIISRISECTVALVLGDRVLSLSDSDVTEDFVDRGVVINPLLYTYLSNVTSSGVLVTGKENLKFLPNSSGNVIAFFSVRDDLMEKGYFVLIRGTKRDREVSISKPEMQRRLDIINDIVVKI